MSCCDKQSVREFVVQKAKNMRAMLEPYIKTEEHKTLLSQYNENDVEKLIHTHLAPLYATGTLSLATDTLCKELSIEDPAIKDKVGRYFQCFCESMLVKSS
jgi:hypothetical protein